MNKRWLGLRQPALLVSVLALLAVGGTGLARQGRLPLAFYSSCSWEQPSTYGLEASSEKPHLSKIRSKRRVVPHFPGEAPEGEPRPWKHAGRALHAQATIRPLLARISPESLRATIKHLSTNYANRYYLSAGGRDSSRWIFEQFKALAQKRSDVSVERVSHPDFEQVSVVARILGNGPLAHERVILGGHIDSIHGGLSGKEAVEASAPGADDNASGTASLIEAFRILAASGYKPQRTIEIMGYAAEEVGLIGSQTIAQAYQENCVSVAGVLQLDGTMYPDRESPYVALVTDFVSPELNAFTAQLVETYLAIPWKHTACNYGCSDHVSWTLAGYPAVFPYSIHVPEENKHIHTPHDTLEKLSIQHGVEFVKLALAFLVELSSEPSSKGEAR